MTQRLLSHKAEPKDYCDYCESEMTYSKKGNLYCTNLCWTKEPWKSRQEEDH